MTDEYMNELWQKIEAAMDKAEAEPTQWNKEVVMILLNDYDAKQKQKFKDERDREQWRVCVRLLPQRSNVCNPEPQACMGPQYTWWTRNYSEA